MRSRIRRKHVHDDVRAVQTRPIPHLRRALRHRQPVRLVRQFSHLRAARVHLRSIERRRQHDVSRVEHALRHRQHLHLDRARVVGDDGEFDRHLSSMRVLGFFVRVRGRRRASRRRAAVVARGRRASRRREARRRATTRRGRARRRAHGDASKSGGGGTLFGALHQFFRERFLCSVW